MKVCICVGAALIAGCAGSQLPANAPLNESAPAAYTHHKTFHYIGKRQLFKVPQGVTRIRVIALGGNGGGTKVSRGGRVTAVIPVLSGETLAVYVGGNGTKTAGGFNGGGDGGANGFGNGNAYGGGGASDVREGGNSLKDRILVVGGGGGQGGWDSGGRYGPYGVGGKGGPLTGGTGQPGYGNYYSTNDCSGKYSSGYGGCPGTGGTQSAGGNGGGEGTGVLCWGTQGFPGSFGMGGQGAIVGKSSSGSYYECGGLGGGGGGGYYGGGGGGQGASYGSSPIGGGGGGGGGSSYVEPSATDVRMWGGWRQDQHGLVVFSW